MGGRLTGVSAQFSAARQLDRAVSRPATRGVRGIAGFLYYAALIGLVLVAPAWLALRDVVTSGNAVFDAIYSIPLPALVLACALPLSLLAFGLGPSLGPIRGDPFTLNLIGSSALDRRATYGLPLVHSGSLLVGVLAVATILLWSFEPASVLTLVLALAAVVSVSSVVLMSWLLGMVASPLVARLVATIGVIPVALLAAGLRARYFARSANIDSIIVLVISVLLFAAAVIGCVLLLPKVRSERVLEQADRWSLIALFAGLGDLTTARSQLQESTGILRFRPVPKAMNYWALNAWAGLTGLIRAPWRIVWILVLETIAIIMVTSLPFVSSVAVIGAAAVTQYLAFSLFGDRIRLAFEQGLSPSLLGGTPVRAIVAQLVVPLMIHLFVVGVGLVVASKVFGLNISVVMPWTLLMTPVYVLVAVYSSLKRQPPALLQTPIITPMGDQSVVLMLLWQLDFVILVAAAGIVMSAVISAPTPSVILAIGLIMMWALLGTRRRFRRI